MTGEIGSIVANAENEEEFWLGPSLGITPERPRENRVVSQLRDAKPFRKDFMTDKQRIIQLERMVKTLTESLSGVVSIINTGSYEYALQDLRTQLDDVKEWCKCEEDELCWRHR